MDKKAPDTDSKDVESSAPSTSQSTSQGVGRGWRNRTFTKDNKKTARHFFSAYAQTWIGLSPIWLMGEALTPGAKVGTKFKEGRSKLVAAAQEVSKVVSSSGQDIVVIIDKKLGEGKGETSKAAEVIKAAGLV